MEQNMGRKSLKAGKLLEEKNEKRHTCLYKKALDELYDGIYIADQQGKTIYVNEAYLKMTNLKYEDVIGQYVSDLLEKGVYTNAVTPEVIKKKGQVNSIGKSKKGVEMLITGKPVFGPGGDLEYVIVIDRDITDLNEMKSRLEMSEKRIQAVEREYMERHEEIDYLKKQVIHHDTLIGESDEMQEVMKMVAVAAPLDVTVLITGESGVGKEVVANEIFEQSKRKDQPFIKVNCAAIPSNLIEAELFGYEKGAFTGAIKSKPGLFQLAHKGTLFLDEIGEIPLEIQAKLLRAIQEQEVTKVGGIEPEMLDVRLIAATNQNLFEKSRKGAFREDLYYRLNVFPIHIPPLRERKGDIRGLIDYFLASNNKKYGKDVKIDIDGLSMLHHYTWPGNVRELKNVIERLVIISDEHAFIDAKQISRIIYPDKMAAPVYSNEYGLKEMIEQIERQILKEVLHETGSTRNAAKRLKIDQSTVVKKAKKYGINLKEKNHHT
ncbi:UNVERIFIED_ORG: PAS domain S-box-containing protein/TyrR family helix-turn-helix protein [Heyndrickxia coagulans]